MSERCPCCGYSGDAARSDVKSPLLVKRHCGGWMARAPAGESLRIAVMADTPEEARDLYFATIAEWRKTLASGRLLAEATGE